MRNDEVEISQKAERKTAEDTWGRSRLFSTFARIRTYILTGSVALLLVPVLPVFSQAQVGKSKSTVSEDRGRAQLAQTLLTYQQLNSYQGRSLVDLNLLQPGGISQAVSAESTALWYKRPNKLAIKLTSNKVGVEVYCDGKTLSVYLVDAQKYFSVPAPATMPEVAKVLHEKAGIDGILDPLFFLSTPTVPTTLQHISLNTDKMAYNGHTATELLCEWRVSDTLKKANFFFQDQAKWLLTIDNKSSVLLQTKVTVPGTAIVQVIKEGKKVAMPMKVAFEMKHRVVEAVPNANFPDTVFAFTPPKGATRQRDVLELIGKPNGAVNNPNNNAKNNPSSSAGTKNNNVTGGGNNGIKF